MVDGAERMKKRARRKRRQTRGIAAIIARASRLNRRLFDIRSVTAREKNRCTSTKTVGGGGRGLVRQSENEEDVIDHV
jgi:hypothetical protein